MIVTWDRCINKWTFLSSRLWKYCLCLLLALFVNRKTEKCIKFWYLTCKLFTECRINRRAVYQECSFFNCGEYTISPLQINIKWVYNQSLASSVVILNWYTWYTLDTILLFGNIVTMVSDCSATWKNAFLLTASKLNAKCSKNLGVISIR